MLQRELFGHVLDQTGNGTCHSGLFLRKAGLQALIRALSSCARRHKREAGRTEERELHHILHRRGQRTGCQIQRILPFPGRRIVRLNAFLKRSRRSGTAIHVAVDVREPVFPFAGHIDELVVDGVERVVDPRARGRHRSGNACAEAAAERRAEVLRGPILQLCILRIGIVRRHRGFIRLVVVRGGDIVLVFQELKHDLLRIFRQVLHVPLHLIPQRDLRRLPGSFIALPAVHHLFKDVDEILPREIIYRLFCASRSLFRF